MSPQDLNSFRFSARCLAGNGLGSAPLHHLDAGGGSRWTPQDVAGVGAVTSVGFIRLGNDTEWLPADQPGLSVAGLARLLLDAASKLLPKTSASKATA